MDRGELRPIEDVQADLENEVRAKARAEARQARIDTIMKQADQDPAAIEAFVRQYTGKP